MFVKKITQMSFKNIRKNVKTLRITLHKISSSITVLLKCKPINFRFHTARKKITTAQSRMT